MTGRHAHDYAMPAPRCLLQWESTLEPADLSQMLTCAVQVEGPSVCIMCRPPSTYIHSGGVELGLGVLTYAVCCSMILAGHIVLAHFDEQRAAANCLGISSYFCCGPTSCDGKSLLPKASARLMA